MSDTNPGRFSIASQGEHHDDAIVEHEEGGTKAWLTVVASFLVYFPSFGFINSFGFFQEYYQNEYLRSYSPSTIAFIGTIQLTLLYIMSPVVGSLFDAYGAKASHLYIIAMIGCSTSIIALSFTHPHSIWQQFLTQGILFGLSAAFGTQPANSIVSQHFKKKRALARGIVASGSSVGGVCLPIMFSHLVPKIGFAWSTRAVALICIICYGFAIILSQPGRPPSGLRHFSKLIDFGGYKDIRYAMVALGSLIVNFGLYIPYFYVEPYVASQNPSSSLLGYLLPIINGSSLFGRIFGGYMADRIGRFNILYSFTIVSGVSCFALWLPSHSASLSVAFTCIYGFASGIFISVGGAAISQITPEDKQGARIGAYSGVLAIATLTGTPIGGALIREHSGNPYQYVIIFSGTTIVTGGLILFLARVLCDNNLRRVF